MTAFYAYLEMVYHPLNRLSELNIQLANSRAAIDPLSEFFDTEPESQNETALSITIQRGGMQFHDLVFGYRAGFPVCKGPNVRIEPGERAALVGANGAGKSTMIKLLMPFSQLWQGKILIAGQDISGVNTISLRFQIAVVQQDPIMFSGTIEDNNRIGKPMADIREIRMAAELANLLPFVDALERLMSGRTTIIIAHRLSSVILSHRIIVLHLVQVVQEGTNEELIRDRAGYYYQLCSAFYRHPGEDWQAPLLATG